jgi:hypothetical protein
VFEKNSNFIAENLQKIAENCDHVIDPWQKMGKTFFRFLSTAHFSSARHPGGDRTHERTVQRQLRDH